MLVLSKNQSRLIPCTGTVTAVHSSHIFSVVIKSKEKSIELTSTTPSSTQITSFISVITWSYKPPGHPSSPNSNSHKDLYIVSSSLSLSHSSQNLKHSHCAFRNSQSVTGKNLCLLNPVFKLPFSLFF